MLSPIETLSAVRAAAIKKANSSAKKLFILSFLAGLFIAFAALASTIAAMNLLKNPETFGLGKLVQGLVFAGGLIMVVLGGAELFTGNSLMITALLSKEISLKKLLRNWGIVYLGNFLGAFFLAACASAAHLFAYNGGLLGSTFISIANQKISLEFWPALILGLLCNILVCLAVWFAFSAKTTQGKILAIIFPILIFIICSFEHSIANMFYIPAGFFASGTVNFFLSSLLHNLIPVTLGNILGGGLFVATAYSFSLNNDKINLCTSEITQKNQKTNTKPQKIQSNQKSQKSQKNPKPQKSPKK